MASSSDAQTVDSLYRDHHSWLISWLRKKLSSPDDAADMAHNTFIRLISGKEVGTIREPRAYLATIARSQVINHYRRRDIERACLEALASLPNPEAMSPEKHHQLLEALYQINALLDGLPTRVKKAFLMSQLDGLTYREIGQHLGVSVSSIKKYMYKATSHCLAVQLELAALDKP